MDARPDACFPANAGHGVSGFDRAVLALVTILIVGWIVLLIAYANATA